MDYTYCDLVRLELELDKEQESVLSPYDNFVYALNVKETKRQYPHRLDIFMSFIGLQGTIEEKCAKLYEISKDNGNANLLL